MNRTVIAAVEARLKAENWNLLPVYLAWRGHFGGTASAADLLAYLKTQPDSPECLPTTANGLGRWLSKVRVIEAPHLPKKR